MAAKYERITDDLRQKIRSHELAAGKPMPSQASLADQYKVSLPTVQQALGVLMAEGLIDAVQGVGTFVRAPRRRVRRSPERYHWEKARALLPLEERSQTGAAERDTGAALEDLDFRASYEVMDADGHLAGAFGFQDGTKLLHRAYRTVIRSEGAALSLIDSYVVYEMAARNPQLLDSANEPWPGGTNHQLRTIGVEIDRITDEITARPPQGNESELLGIGHGVSVIVLRKTSTDTSGKVVEISDVVMPGDRTVMVYQTQLERWQS